jgi:hypothetical protein
MDWMNKNMDSLVSIVTAYRLDEKNIDSIATAYGLDE